MSCREFRLPKLQAWCKHLSLPSFGFQVPGTYRNLLRQFGAQEKCLSVCRKASRWQGVNTTLETCRRKLVQSELRSCRRYTLWRAGYLASQGESGLPNRCNRLQLPMPPRCHPSSRAPALVPSLLEVFFRLPWPPPQRHPGGILSRKGHNRFQKVRVPPFLKIQPPVVGYRVLYFFNFFISLWWRVDLF